MSHSSPRGTAENEAIARGTRPASRAAMLGSRSARKVVSTGVIVGSSPDAKPMLFAELSDGRFLVWKGIARPRADTLAVEMRSHGYDEVTVRRVWIIDHEGLQATCREVDAQEIAKLSAS